jgi:hypothetical protein
MARKIKKTIDVKKLYETLVKVSGWKNQPELIIPKEVFKGGK